MTADTVEIFEVGPRDGLQNEAREIPTAEKVALIDALSACGFRRIESGAFVSPKWVPQMADSADVFAQISRADDIRYAALAPNLKGFERAVSAKVSEIAIFAAASEAFSQANINASIAESLERFVPIMAAAHEIGMPVRGYVSTVVDCPYSGAVPPDAVVPVVKAMKAMGCYEISLGDTTGKGQPDAVDAMLSAVCDAVPAATLAGHFHDTSGAALDNVEVALGHGLRVFDAAVGGLGGCPYSPGAQGNVATEALMRRLDALGYSHGLDLARVEQAATMAQAMRIG